MSTPRELAAAAERRDRLVPGATERFSGYGVMSVPFASGHVLGLRRFPVTSIGPGYTSVWLRDPDGAWHFHTTVPPEVSCPRYFGSAIESAAVLDIAIDWTGDHSFTVTIGDDVDLRWDVALTATPVSRVMSGMAGILPDAFWRSGAFLSMLGGVAGPALRAGRIGMVGSTPNRQRYLAKVLRMWVVASSSASLGGEDLGAPRPLREQTRLGDFWMPQRGIFMIGGAHFHPQDAGAHPPTTKATATGV